MSASEVLEMANYNGDLSMGWKDFICGGVGVSACSKEEFVNGVLEYFDGLKQSAEDAHKEVDENGICQDGGWVVKTKEEIRQYVERSAKVERDDLAQLAAALWDDTVRG